MPLSVASPTVRLVCCVTPLRKLSKILFHNMLQCFCLFYSHMQHIHQLYLVCNPSMMVLRYFFTRETTVVHLNQIAEL